MVLADGFKRKFSARLLDEAWDHLHRTDGEFFRHVRRSTCDRLYVPLAHALSAKTAAQPPVIAVVGWAGTGKTTLGRAVTLIAEACFNGSIASFSLDDVYHRRSFRLRLAEQWHPLFEFRGPAGTHDLKQAMDVIQRLQQASPSSRIRLPRFDKRADNPAPLDTWPVFKGRPSAIVIDNWFWNIAPVPETMLEPPVNEREALADPHRVWRVRVNRQLAEYQELFHLADGLIALKAPSWNAAVQFRKQQDRDLRPGLGVDKRARFDELVAEFLALFERLALRAAEPPADIVVQLNAAHDVSNVELR